MKKRLLTKQTLEKFSEFLDYDLFSLRKRKSIKTALKHDIIAADYHLPFWTPVVPEGRDLWILGDLLDNFAVSHFKKRTTKQMSLKQEFSESFKIIADEICPKYRTVWYMEGNHCNRYAKYLYDYVPENIMGFLETNINILRDLICLIPNLQIIAQRGKSRVYSHLYQRREILFSHIERSYKDTGKLMIEISKDITAWEEEYRLKPYSVIFQGHSHRYGHILEGRKHLFQLPAMLDPSRYAFDYAYDSRMRGKPTAIGYHVVNYDENGNYDYNKSKTIILNEIKEN